MDNLDNKQKNNNQNMQDKNPNNGNILKFVIISLVLTVFLNMLLTGIDKSNTDEIPYSEFMDMLGNGEIKYVTILSDRLKIEPIEGYKTDKIKEIEAEIAKNSPTETETPGESPTGDTTQITGNNELDAMLNEYADKNLEGDTTQLDALFGKSHPLFGSNPPTTQYLYTGRIVSDMDLDDKLDAAKVGYESPIIENNPFLDFFVEWLLPILFIYGIMMFMISIAAKKMGGDKGGIMGVGRSNAKMYLEEKTGVTFEDVAGQEEAKESLEEIVDYLHHPKKYVDIGAKQPKGALLVGPPGTGKTLLAKAVAGEANVPFFSLSGSDFVEMFVGVGASRVRDLFREANQHAPCIIFIDEVDAIGKSRDSQIGGNDEREQTLNQLLSEMDGFDSSKGVVILAATNRPEILDQALLRPGRFDRRIIVEKPDLVGRQAILEVHIKKVKISPNINLKEIALATSGAVGADLANMVNEAALRAVRLGRKQVIQEDLMESVELVIAGKEKKDRILGEKERRIVAFHEVGHALASALQKNSKPVQKITIVPRTMGALGYTMQVPEEEKYLMSKQEILDEITVFLAGRCAEVIEFDTETTGASNDIERATTLARNMVTLYGMSKEFGMMALEKTNSQYLQNGKRLLVSEATGAELDKTVMKIINGCYKKATRLLKENYEALVKISEYLIEKETISGETFMNLLNNEEINEVEGTETFTIFEYMDENSNDDSDENSEVSEENIKEKNGKDIESAKIKD
ncbi:MAG: ATP-dependent zinc metalloprotease FtsH [Lachnospirales bacterium]